MKAVNLYSVIEAYRHLEPPLFQKMMNSSGITAGSGGIRDYELDCIEGLLQTFETAPCGCQPIADGYFVGYSIPQIGKEFDLLRFGEDTVINIELKTTSTPEKILKQQQKNRHYLSFLGKEVHIYTYVHKERRVYKFIGDACQEVNISELIGRLKRQKMFIPRCIDNMFNPSDYLISPFNSTEKFLAGAYFLTMQQETICKEILHDFSDAQTRVVALTGDAGTGKTLLTYHIAKECMRAGGKVLILNCAQLNAGHEVLKADYGWEIHMSRYAPDIAGFDLVIIDEAQRMSITQIRKYADTVKQAGKKCIFSFDKKQYLSVSERDNHLTIEQNVSKVYSLTDKIRTNKEIAYFIRQLFDCAVNIPHSDYSNIRVLYCHDYPSAKDMLSQLADDGWHTPAYTPGTRAMFYYERYSPGKRECAHSVIGQEFDKVAVVIDDKFMYDSNGKLYGSNIYYSQRQMLYQIITRTRKELCLVIVNNPTMLNRCLDILGHN